LRSSRVQGKKHGDEYVDKDDAFEHFNTLNGRRRRR
jgi:hypothetical protein